MFHLTSAKCGTIFPESASMSHVAVELASRDDPMSPGPTRPTADMPCGVGGCTHGPRDDGTNARRTKNRSKERAHLGK